MSPSVATMTFGAGALVMSWALYRALRFAPSLAGTGQKRSWTRLVVLVGLFVPGYSVAAGLAYSEHLGALVNLTSVIFLLGAVFVFYSVFVTRSVARDLDKRVARRTAELEKTNRQLRRDLDKRVAQRTAELEKTNRQLRLAKEEAQATNRSKSQFLANMSHEIRTPLTSILGYSDLLLRTDPEPDDRLKNLRTIRRNGQHLLELVNDVLDISKIEAGEMTVELLECSPWQLVREVRSLLRSQAQAKDLGFEIEAQGPIPEYIRSDPVRLRQILLNLVGNAIKFTEAGKVRLVVRIDDPSARVRSRLRFDVIDTGIGMADEQKQDVFIPFRQASASTARLFGGTGLGLTISRRLALMLGGNITVESLPGVGSTFSLTVDAGRMELGDLLDGPLGTETDQLPTSVPTVWTKRLGGRVLLAEDGVDNRRFISAVLQQVGADVTLVENGQQAVVRALEARDLGKAYDVVLMDMQMPVLDGYGAARELREAGYEGTIVALTAYAMSGDREKCLEAGCDDFVAKPIDVERFLASLAEYVRGTPKQASRSAGSGRSAPRRPPALLGNPPSPPVPGRGDDSMIVSTLGGHPTFAEVVRGFVDRLPERLEELQSAYRDADLETLRTLAHGLRGAGGTYGFKPLTDAAEKLELQVAEGAEDTEIGAALEQLAAVCHRVST